MKILIASTLYFPYVIGGAEKSTKLIAEGYKKRGYEVEVLTTSNRDYTDIIDGIKVHYVKFKHVFWRYKSREKNTLKKILWRILEFYNPFNKEKIRKLLLEIKPDLIHTNNIAGIGIEIWKQATSQNIKVIHTARDYYLLCARAGMFRKGKPCSGQCLLCRMYTKNFKKYSNEIEGFVGVSDFVKDIHLQHDFFQNTYLNQAIPNIFQGVRKKCTDNTKSSDKIIFGTLGSIRETKGVVDLIENMNFIEQIELLVAGEFNNQKIENKFMELISNKPVKYLGYVKPEMFFNKIDYLIHPALWYEPFPRVVIESFSFGIPVIASNNGGTKEAITGQDTGLVYSEYEELNQIIKKIVAGYYNYEELSENCYQFAAKFSEENIIKQYEEIIKRLA